MLKIIRLSPEEQQKMPPIRLRCFCDMVNGYTSFAKGNDVVEWADAQLERSALKTRTIPRMQQYVL